VAADGELTVSRPSWGREAALVLGLFAAYRLGRLLTAGDTQSALANAQLVLGWQEALRLPGERALQDWALHAPALVRAANVYYAGVHFPATVLFLIVLYWRRPGHYQPLRSLLAVVTACALALHLALPLAPPRMLSDRGFVDTAALLGPSVYGPPGAGSLSNQFAAMPSLHVGWAMVVALGVVLAFRTPWRWCALLHPAVTAAVVIVTANHYWLDCIVACVLVAAASGLVRTGAPGRAVQVRSRSAFPRRDLVA
jgi:hypothetical protein